MFLVHIIYSWRWNMDKHSKLLIFKVIPAFLLVTGVVGARTVTFTRVTVDSGVNTPHGDWAGDIDGTSPQYALDIFATIGGDGEAVWYANGGTGTSWSPKNSIWSTTTNPYNFEIAGADLNGDGNVDAVSCDLGTAATSTSYLALHTNTGGGSFTTNIIGNVAGRFRQMRLRDIDADNDSDIVITVNTQYSQSGIGVYWYRNNGGMSFTEVFIDGSNAWKVACFDDDGDGHLELVISENSHGPGGVFDPCRLIFYKNDGSENFTRTVIDNSFTAGGGVGYGGAGVACADFDGDGRTDIVCGDQHNGILCWYKNLGGSSFSKNIIDSSCPQLDGIDVADFEPDGDMDIVAAGRQYWLNWYENDGNGNYLDGDSCCDIVMTEASFSGRIFAYLNPCGGTSVEDAPEPPSKNWLKTPSLVGSNSVNIEYGIDKRNNVRLEVIDLTGRTIEVLDHGCHREPGSYVRTWDLATQPNGLYVLRLRIGHDLSITRKVIVIRKK
jgi:hypothetical protein